MTMEGQLSNVFMSVQLFSLEENVPLHSGAIKADGERIK